MDIDVIIIRNMKRSWIKEHLLGYKYIVNENSKQVHYVKNLHKNCFIKSMSNARYVREEEAQRLIRSLKYDGCVWCMRDMNRGWIDEE